MSKIPLDIKSFVGLLRKDFIRTSKEIIEIVFFV